MAIKIAINGFGRIGRNVLRAIAESNRNDIQVVAINDLGPVETNAHLLRFDSVHGRFPGEIKVTKGSIDYGAGPITVTAIRDPHELPHKELEVDIALECTGLFTAREKAAAHLKAGAKRVLISAPGDNADLTVVFGVNHDKLTKDHLIVSNASCTTNCLAPVAKILNDAIGIETGFMTTIHSYTGDQPTLDPDHHRCGAGRRPRPARAQWQTRWRSDSRADPQCVRHRFSFRRQTQDDATGNQGHRQARLGEPIEGHSHIH